MENKILQLLMEKGEVSMNNDIFPVLFEEFDGAFLDEQTGTLFVNDMVYKVVK